MALWCSYYNIPKSIFYLLKGDYTLRLSRGDTTACPGAQAASSGELKVFRPVVSSQYGVQGLGGLVFRVWGLGFRVADP